MCYTLNSLLDFGGRGCLSEETWEIMNWLPVPCVCFFTLKNFSKLFKGRDWINLCLKEGEKLENRFNAVLPSSLPPPPSQFVFNDYHFGFPTWLSFCVCCMIFC